MHPKVAISLLVFIFVGPIVVSWIFVNSDIDWTSRGLGNHGVLIRPAIDLRENESVASLFEFAELAPSHWALISLENKACDEGCFERIEKLTVLHAVMGSSTDRLRTFAVAPALTSGPNPVSNLDSQETLDQPRLLADSGVASALKVALDNNEKGISYPLFVVVDWRKQLMLRFASGTPSADIKKDLQKLLRASKIR